MANSHLANPSPLGFGGFATTLMTLSLSMMGFRGVSNQTLFISNLCFLAGVGLLISAQWEMLKGNTFSYTVLTAFGLYYGGYGVMLMPSLGVIGAYGGETAEYHNAFAFYQLSESLKKSLLRMWQMIEPSLVLSEFPFPTCCFADPCPEYCHIRFLGALLHFQLRCPLHACRK
ncbi:hypothetical protein PMG11_09410 [Penicillium brasilianum]|uniref:Uncharacterized protein n=1 Tax=Penicillium brasilianum TaxID=104259 RepID=A0A0F7TW08_PENBI|nr:hypothetical protein PMG11_09410 [Penicillium brasilianum]